MQRFLSSFIFALILNFGVQAQCLPEPITADNIERLGVLTSLSDVYGDIEELLWSVDGARLYVAISNEPGYMDEIQIYEAENLSNTPEIIRSDENFSRIWVLESGLVIATNYPELLEIPENITVKTVPADIMAVSPDGAFGVRASLELIELVDLESHEVIREYPTEYKNDCGYACYIEDVAISPDGRFLAYRSIAIPIALINLETDELIYDAYILNEIIFNSDASLIASVATELGYIGSRGVALTDSSTGERVSYLDVSGYSGTNAVFSPDDELLVTGVLDPNSSWLQFAIWDVDTLISTGEGSYATALFIDGYGGRNAFHPSGTLIATSIVHPQPAAVVNIWGISLSDECS